MYINTVYTCCIVEYMSRSMGTKGGTISYHIGYGGYGTTLGWHVINGVTDCC